MCLKLRIIKDWKKHLIYIYIFFKTFFLYYPHDKIKNKHKGKKTVVQPWEVPTGGGYFLHDDRYGGGGGKGKKGGKK
jgi:hypothetical protein